MNLKSPEDSSSSTFEELEVSNAANFANFFSLSNVAPFSIPTTGFAKSVKFNKDTNPRLAEFVLAP
jgi:hypothetical protein